MRRLSLPIVFASLIANGQLITDEAIRNEASRLGKAATGEPAVMAMDTLLRLATVIKPYAPVEAKLCHEQAIRHAAGHRDMLITSSTVDLWMDLDPVAAETELRKFRDQRYIVSALAGYYQRRNQLDQAAKLAAETLRMAPVARPKSRNIDSSSLIRIVATQSPQRALELLSLPHIEAEPRFGGIVLSAIEGLLAAAPKEGEAVLRAVKELQSVIERTDFVKGSPETILMTTMVDSKPVRTSDTKSTIEQSLELARRIADPETRDEAQRTLRTRSTTFQMAAAGRPKSPPPVDAQLPLAQAIEEIQKREPAYQRIGELWRYLVSKPRDLAESKPIVDTLITWSQNAGNPTSDPAWFLQSLLNLDGRLGPPGRQWVLASELRPKVFVAAAGVYQKQDRAPDRLQELVLAMVAEGVGAPAEPLSARNRMDIEMLRRRLEVRYDFSLPTPNNNLTVRLQNYRGKVVILNFWATWCVPCRAELPALAALAKEFRDQLAVVAITDEQPSTVTDFLEKNPVGVRVLVDRPRDTFRHYNVNGLPQTFLIGADGVLRKHYKAEAGEATLRSAVQDALAAAAK